LGLLHGLSATRRLDGDHLSAQTERRILVGHQREGIAIDAIAPPKYANDEIKQTARIRRGDENREPRSDDRNHCGEPEKEEHDVVRNCEKPFDQRQPAVQLVGIWIRKIEVDCLVFIGPSSLPIGGEDW
jgi:hypothetical protein